MELILFVGNHNLIELIGLKNAATESWENSATVNLTLRDKDGQEISGETWPVTLNYVGASNGNYRGTVDEGIAIQHGDLVTAVITAVASGLTGKWETSCRVETRT